MLLDVPVLIADIYVTVCLSSTVMTSLIELSKPKTLPTVFAVSSVAWTTGSVIAPGLGGFLAEPAVLYPGLFKGTIWEEYPYALSGVVVSSPDAHYT